MATIKEMRDILEASLPKKRFGHSLLVYETAKKMADHHRVDKEKVAIGALLHDCGRQIPTGQLLDKSRELGLDIDWVEENQPILLHAKLGVYYAREKYGVTDPEILDAIALHTTGDAGMSDIAKIVYLADLLEPSRDFPGIGDLRKLAEKDLDRAMLKAYTNTMRYLMDYDLLIHPRAVAGYNEIAARYKKESRNK